MGKDDKWSQPLKNQWKSLTKNENFLSGFQVLNIKKAIRENVYLKKKENHALKEYTIIENQSLIYKSVWKCYQLINSTVFIENRIFFFSK